MYMYCKRGITDVNDVCRKKYEVQALFKVESHIWKSLHNQMFLFYSGDTKYVTRVLVYKPAAVQVQGIRYISSRQPLVKKIK